MKNTRKMVSRKDAAEFLGCSLQTVTNWVETGIIKGHNINGRLFIDGNTLHAVADTVKELEESKRKISELLDESEKASKELSDEVNRKREELFLFRHSSASKITRDVIKSVVSSYGDSMPCIAKDILVDIINYGSVDGTAKRFDIDVPSVIRIADIACRIIGQASYGKKVKENKNLKCRLAELEVENADLRKGILQEKSTDTGLMQVPIRECDLSVRTINCLTVMGVKTVGDLKGMSLSEISRFRNVGRKTLNELEEFGKLHGLGLK